MKILFSSIDIDKPAINYKKTSDWITEVINFNNKNIKEIAIVFCNDNYILEVNKKFLKHDYYTDIITFDYSNKNNISGELLISIDTVISNSKKFKTKFYEELHRVIIHGILHLLGYKDKTDEQKMLMKEQENYCLEKL